MLSYLNENDNFVFASTHDLELTEYPFESYNYDHFPEMIIDEELSFDYLLKDGKLTHTNTIKILESND